jgi:CubicO group peptidase (beta-lactamase class C family)
MVPGAALRAALLSALSAAVLFASAAVPAGALSSTAADMARFMTAHLNGGRQGTTRILSAETVEAMQRRSFTNHPAVSGLTYGFQELHIAGMRVLAQPGDMLHFTAGLFLLPEQKLGSLSSIPVAYGFCGKRGASIAPESQARRRVIAGSVARSRNAAIGCERRASRRKIHL